MALFTVPADFNKDTITIYSQMNRSGTDKVVETYGQLTQSSFIQSGRASHLLPHVDKQMLQEYIVWSNRNGIRFNYTFNPTCLGNMEFSSKGLRKIKRWLDELYELGVRSITVALPSLLELIHEDYRKMEIRASTLCGIDSPNKVRRFYNKGVRRMVVDNDVNRHFGQLKKMTQIGGQLEVIVNSLCFSECIYKTYHQNQAAHYQIGQIEDYYLNRCLLRRAEHPGNLLRMNWIRPEDLRYYEDISIRFFKIQGRQAVQNGNIRKCVQAYLKRNFDGNLFDLLHCFLSSNKAPYYIDNKRLDGFLDPFVANDHFCAKDCTNCGYCDSFAEKCLDISRTDEINSMISTHFYACDRFRARF